MHKSVGIRHVVFGIVVFLLIFITYEIQINSPLTIFDGIWWSLIVILIFFLAGAFCEIKMVYKIGEKLARVYERTIARIIKWIRRNW